MRVAQSTNVNVFVDHIFMKTEKGKKKKVGGATLTFSGEFS